MQPVCRNECLIHGLLPRLLAAALRPTDLRLLVLAHSGLVITDDALYGADNEERALLAADGNGNGAECHGGSPKSQRDLHLYFALIGRRLNDEIVRLRRKVILLLALSLFHQVKSPATARYAQRTSIGP